MHIVYASILTRTSKGDGFVVRENRREKGGERRSRRGRVEYGWEGVFLEESTSSVFVTELETEKINSATIPKENAAKSRALTRRVVQVFSKLMQSCIGFLDLVWKSTCRTCRILPRP